MFLCICIINIQNFKVLSWPFIIFVNFDKYLKIGQYLGIILCGANYY